MRLYITGIKNMADAQKAVSLGASAVGIKLGYKKDMVDPEMARDIFFNLPIFISRVGIFADEKRYSVQEVVTFCRLDTLHFIGNEQPADLKKYSEHVLKTFDQENFKKSIDYELQGTIINLDSIMWNELEMINITESALIFFGDLSTTDWLEAIKKYHPYGMQWDLSCQNTEKLNEILSLCNIE